MATVTTTITIYVTLTRQTGQWSVLNHSQTNSQAWAQPIGFRVCCFVHLCISLGKNTWWLILILLHSSYPGIFTSVLSPECFASNMITANWGFNRLIRIPFSTRTFQEVPKHSILSTRLSLQSSSLHSSMYENIIDPGETFHTFTFNISINIRSKNRLNSNH